jgi:hypothetical protein
MFEEQHKRSQKKSMKRLYGQPASLKMAQGLVPTRSHRKLVPASSQKANYRLAEHFQAGYASHAVGGLPNKQFESIMKHKKKSRSRSKKHRGPLDSAIDENHPIADSINIKVFGSDVDDHAEGLDSFDLLEDEEAE